MSLFDKVDEVIQAIRPYILRDGGDVSLVDVDEDEKVAYVRLLGACASCPSSIITLKSGIERAIIEELPEITSVEQVF